MSLFRQGGAGVVPTLVVVAELVAAALIVRLGWELGGRVWLWLIH